MPNKRLKLAGPARTEEASVCALAAGRRGAELPLRRRVLTRSLGALR